MGKPPKDVNVVLGFVREEEDPDVYKESNVFFWHAIEWNDPTRPPDARVPGKATQLAFDPMNTDLLCIYRNGISEPWLAKVTNVSIVRAEDRAKEMERPIDSMNAAYYYRLELGQFYEEPKRDVRELVGKRPGLPVAVDLAKLAQCNPVSLSAKSD